MVEEHFVSHQRDWNTRLSIFFFAYRVSTHDTTGLTPANLVFGRELHLSCDLLFGAPPPIKSNPAQTNQWASQTGYMSSTTMPATAEANR
jgi:hypothetical protein